jgi:hypothetical protein
VRYAEAESDPTADGGEEDLPAPAVPELMTVPATPAPRRPTMPSANTAASVNAALTARGCRRRALRWFFTF